MPHSPTKNTRLSVWLGRKQQTGRGGGASDKPPAIRSLDPVQLPQWRMPLDVDAWPKPAEAFVIGHLYEGVMYFRDITCLTSHAVAHFRSGIPHSSRTTGQATISCCKIPNTGSVEWSLSVNPDSHPVEKSTVSADATAQAHTSCPALKGTLIGVPYRYFHMRFHEGRALDAMLQELKDRTSAKQILAISP